MTLTILDGGMGQELLARTGATPTGLWSTQVMIDHPDAVRSVHDDYFAAGADIATTNTYAIHRDRLVKAGIEAQFEALHQQAVDIAVAARDAHGAGQVAGALGPLGWSYKAEFAPPSAEAAPLYAEIVAMHDPHVDLFILETMCGIDQARGGLMGCADTDKPVWLALSVDDDDGTKLRSGEPLAEILPLLEEFDAAAVLLNCSRPEAISAGLPVLATANRPFGAYANGFTSISDSFKAAGETVDKLEARRDLGPVEYADFTDDWVKQGASIIGGCCEVGPAHIAEIARRTRKTHNDLAHPRARRDHRRRRLWLFARLSSGRARLDRHCPSRTQEADLRHHMARRRSDRPIAPEPEHDPARQIFRRPLSSGWRPKPASPPACAWSARSPSP